MKVGGQLQALLQVDSVPGPQRGREQSGPEMVLYLRRVGKREYNSTQSVNTEPLYPAIVSQKNSKLAL